MATLATPSETLLTASVRLKRSTKPCSHYKVTVWNWLKAGLDQNTINRCENSKMEASLKDPIDASDV